MERPIFGELDGRQVRLQLINLGVGQMAALLMRGPGKKGVFSASDGKSYAVYGASCGAPRCMCAVRFKEVK